MSYTNGLLIHSRYADGRIVFNGQKPPRIYGPDPEAISSHSVLRWDIRNNRIYQMREYDAAGFPVRDVDFTNPTFPRSGQPRPGHPGPPHQHLFAINNPNVAPRSGFVRGKSEPLEDLEE